MDWAINLANDFRQVQLNDEIRNILRVLNFEL